MHLACEYPELIKAFIVVDIGPKNYESHHQQILKGLSRLDFDQISTRSEVDKELTKYVQDSITRQFLLKNLYWKSTERLADRKSVV